MDAAWSLSVAVVQCIDGASLNRFALTSLVIVACTDKNEIGSGDEIVEIEWSGTKTLDESLEITALESVSVQPGTHVEIAPGVELRILGALHALGTREEPVLFDAPNGWLGIELQGSLSGSYLTIEGEGGVLHMLSGSLELTDSVLDLRNPKTAPDCTTIDSGTLVLDHVQIAGCYCPLHIEDAISVNVTASVFNRAEVPIMLARVTGSFHRNNLVGKPGMMDIGGQIAVDVSNNYWDGGAPTLVTDNTTQFLGISDWSSEPFEAAGPR